MWNRTKRTENQSDASWFRELLRPAIVSLVPFSYLGLQLGRLLNDVPIWPLGTVIALLPLAIPQSMYSDSRLYRPSPPRGEDPAFMVASPLQKVTSGLFGAKRLGASAPYVRLPEIDTGPHIIQMLIYKLGAPLPLPRSLNWLRNFPSILSVLGLFAVVWFEIFWFRSNKSAHPQYIWVVAALAALIICTAYRSAFRRLYEIYTADAAKTGRYAFPALRR
ncbi:hypothetical protein [Brevundimonas pishanensis]|uniref:hypothetical protein n=1 Tax=Brevundimonas pishanensis TaxID=2896315 RepID=UPI001FA7E5B6|nr:hypothetical protein [Brevundimonas pishanensis]